MRRRVLVLVFVMTLQLAVAAWVIPAQAGTFEDRTFADNFTTGMYSGNEGSHDFNGPWKEGGDDGSSSGGHVYIYGHPRCPTDDTCLAFGDFTGTFGPDLRAQRRADTLGAESIDLSFQYRRWTWQADNFYLDVQVNDGSGWNTLDTISLADTWDADPVQWRRDITSYASDDMGIRFRTSGGSAGGYILIDALEIQATIDITPTAATTNPTTTTTTSSPPPTTTTTSSQTTTITSPTSTTEPTDSATPNTTTLSTTTTTTSLIPGAAVPPRPHRSDETPEPAVAPLSAEEIVDYSSKAEMFLDDVMPTLKAPDMMTPEGEVDASVQVNRSPTQGLMATFSTSTETLQTHGLSVLLLGLLVAWLSVRGLGRSRWRRKEHTDTT